ncbi:hypothetical protein BC938DRAFT_482181 [Jimgerdemannia flammicorona]|uniref:Uncharacterized protein n=1 Tax=Jimgerdemannia flammicorona TaxID=994334 RepID=A0A433QWN1_9FUNG|nr:hypothetical protein BC938DRAFT_482181 [Jimgerdemannia flammicorona]
MYALMEALEEMAEKAFRPRREQGVGWIITGKPDQVFKEVALVTGGYAADFTEHSLLKHSPGPALFAHKHRPINSLPSTFDPSPPKEKTPPPMATTAQAAITKCPPRSGSRRSTSRRFRFTLWSRWPEGAQRVSKVPCREVLHGVGAHRRLRRIEWHCKHYTGTGLVRKFVNGEVLAKEIGINPKKHEEVYTMKSRPGRGKIPGARKFSGCRHHDGQFLCRVALKLPLISRSIQPPVNLFPFRCRRDVRYQPSWLLISPTLRCFGHVASNSASPIFTPDEQHASRAGTSCFPRLRPIVMSFDGQGGTPIISAGQAGLMRLPPPHPSRLLSLEVGWRVFHSRMSLSIILRVM